MLYKSLTTREIHHFLKNITDKQAFIQIISNEGSTLCVPMPFSVAFIVTYIYNERFYIIPHNRISGLCILHIDKSSPIINSILYSNLEKYKIFNIPKPILLVRLVSRTFLLILISEFVSRLRDRILSHQEVIPIGAVADGGHDNRVKITDDTMIYADWNYFSRIQNGINSIGIGVGITIASLSLSTGWENSLSSFFLSKLKSTPIAFDEVSKKSFVVIKGYIIPISRHLNYPIFTYADECIMMEGLEWKPVAICKTKVNYVNNLESIDWYLAYIKSDCFMLPNEIWERIQQEIRIFAEVIFVQAKIGHYNKPIFLKIRGAAYINESAIKISA